MAEPETDTRVKTVRQHTSTDGVMRVPGDVYVEPAGFVAQLLASGVAEVVSETKDEAPTPKRRGRPPAENKQLPEDGETKENVADVKAELAGGDDGETKENVADAKAELAGGDDGETKENVADAKAELAGGDDDETEDLFN